jgi:thiol-disulfide isomerase/thioredoxin
VSAVPDTEDLEPKHHELGSGPWRLGALTALAAVLVVGGVLIFGGSGGGETTPERPPDASITVPPLPATALPDDAAPDFSLDLFDGTSFALAEHLEEDGRPVILNFWASWCPPCRDEMPDLEAAAAAHPEILVLGVAIDDDPLAAEAFVTENGIGYPTGFDAAGRVARRYPSPALPSTFVISADGAVVQTVFGRLSAADIELLIEIALAG